MNRNVSLSSLKYPMEAFALAMVLFSSNMKTGMVIGIALVFGDVLQGVLSEASFSAGEQTLRAMGAVMTAAVMYLLCGAAGLTPDVKMTAGFALLGLLLMKHQEERSFALSQQEEASGVDYNALLLADSAAYLFLVILAALREYLAGGRIFETELQKLDFTAGAYGKPMLALILAGVFAALVNRILRAEAADDAALWVCLPVILLEPSFVLANVPELAGTVIGVVMTAVIYLTLRTKFLLTDPQKHIRGLAVEMTTLGMIYMILQLL